MIQNGYDVILSFDSGKNVVQKIMELGYAPEIFVIDVNDKDMDGVDATRSIKQELPLVKIILYCNDLSKKAYHKFNDDNEIAHYYVDKGANPETLLRALEFCVRGLSTVQLQRQTRNPQKN